MTYNEFIDGILISRGRHLLQEDYKERHHIIPRCCGGTDDEENLIDLLAEEHYEAHKLLALENPDNKGLQFAWIMMTHTRPGKYVTSSEDYAEVRKVHIELVRGRKMSAEFCEKVRISKLGNTNRLGTKTSEVGIQNIRKAIQSRSAMSEETRRKIGDGNKGKTVSEETRKKISDSRKGIKFTDEHKKKLSDWQKGKSKPSSKYEHTKEQGKKAWETRRKNGTASSPTQNKVCITNGTKNAYIHPTDELPDGWTFGCSQPNHPKTYNKTWMNDGVYAYFVNNDEVENYIQLGYVLGKGGYKTNKSR